MEAALNWGVNTDSKDPRGPELLSGNVSPLLAHPQHKLTLASTTSSQWLLTTPASLKLTRVRQDTI